MAEQRKIQLIAGTTYTLSLPKEWVLKNNLTQGNRLTLVENPDRTLLISPHQFTSKTMDEITLNVNEYPDVDEILFSLYYIGVETVHVYGRNGLSKETIRNVRRVVSRLSGTEIVYEDANKMTIKVLLDRSKIGVTQLLYRLNLLLSFSMESVKKGDDMETIRMNEHEIDRLYHLMKKIVSSSLIDSTILHSSSIKNVVLIPSYFLLSKRLENMGDTIFRLAEYCERKKLASSLPLEDIETELTRAITHVRTKSNVQFTMVHNSKLEAIRETIESIDDKEVSSHLNTVVRYLIDIQEEIVNITFYTKLIEKKEL